MDQVWSRDRLKTMEYWKPKFPIIESDLLNPLITMGKHRMETLVSTGTFGFHLGLIFFQFLQKCRVRHPQQAGCLPLAG